MMTKRAHGKTVEINGASHVAYMSHPKETAKLIEEAAATHRSASQCSEDAGREQADLFLHAAKADGRQTIACTPADASSRDNRQLFVGQITKWLVQGNS